MRAGDVADVDLGVPVGREAGFRHPAVIVSAQEVLDQRPNVVFVVPLTSTIRDVGVEVIVDGEVSGLDHRSAAQCQHLRAVSAARIGRVRGNVGPVDLRRMREVIGLLLDIG